MSATLHELREELKDPEHSEGYAESFLDSYIATQIKVLREQAHLSQTELANIIGTRQGVISRIENVNYSKWNISTLKHLARAFRVRLKVSFETYGSLLNDVAAFSRESLQRSPRETDPILYGHTPIAKLPKHARKRRAPSKHSSPPDRRPLEASHLISGPFGIGAIFYSTTNNNSTPTGVPHGLQAANCAMGAAS